MATPTIRLDLEGTKGSLIVRRQRNHGTPGTRSILTRKNTTRMTDEQLLRIRKTMARLIELSPVNLTPEMKKAKAFMIWAEKVPLMQKCDELAAQLQERSYALTTIKECYLRDVVSIRTHLENYYKKNEMENDLKELNSIPSIDLRHLVQKTTKEEPSEFSSYCLKDSVMKAHLLSSDYIQEHWMKNPWDRSKSYAIFRQRKDQMPLSIPSGGNSINLYAPSRHRLYIKYCKQCIGIMTFIAEWNTDVEKMLKQRIEARTNEELRQIIRNLNDYLLDKSEECEKLTQELNGIKNGAKYVQTWHDTEKKTYDRGDLERKIQRFRELYHRWNEESLMGREDYAHLLGKYQHLQQENERITTKYTDQIDHLMRSYEYRIEEKENEVYHLQQTVHEKEIIIDQKVMKIETYEMKLNEQCKETERYIRVNQQLIVSIDEKDKILSDYRLEAMNMIESLQLSISKLTEDMSKLENENERYRKKMEEKMNEPEKRRSSNLVPHQTESAVGLGEQIYEEASEEQPSSNNGHLSQLLRMKAVIGVLPRHLRKVLAHNITKYAPVPIASYSEIDGPDEDFSNEDVNCDTEDVAPKEDEEDLVSIESFGSNSQSEENNEKKKARSVTNSPISKPIVQKKKSEVFVPPVTTDPVKRPTKRMTSVENLGPKKNSSSFTGRKTMMSDVSGVVLASQKFRKSSGVGKRSTIISKASSAKDLTALVPLDKDLSDKSVVAEILAGEDEPDAPTSSPIRTRLVPRHTLRARLSIAKKLSSIEMPVSPANPVVSTIGMIHEEEEITPVKNPSISRMPSASSPISRISSPSITKMASSQGMAEEQEIQLYNQELLLRTNSYSMNPHDSIEMPPSLATLSLHQQSSFHNLSSSYHEGVSNLLELLVPYIKPPTSFKIIAICIRFCIRFKHGIEQKNYDLLGSWGQKTLLRKYILQCKTLQINCERQEIENQKLVKKNEKLFEQGNISIGKINSLEKEKHRLLQQIKELKDDLRRSELLLSRQKIISQTERGISFELMKYTTYLRDRLFILKSAADPPLKLQSERREQIEPIPSSSLIPANSTLIPLPNKSLTRKAELKRKFLRYVTNFLEVIHDHSNQLPLKTFKLSPHYCLNFSSYGSKIRNEYREMKQFFRCITSDFLQFEKKYEGKQQKLFELASKIEEITKSNQCPSCIEYRALYLEQKKREDENKRLRDTQIKQSVLDFNWEDSTDNPTIQRLKERLRKEISDDIAHRIEREYQSVLERYIKREEELNLQINTLEKELVQNKFTEVRTNNLIKEKQKELSEKEISLNYLMKENFVLKRAVEDSYRVSQFESDQLEEKDNLINEMKLEIERKKENMRNMTTQLEEGQESLVWNGRETGDIHHLDDELQEKAKKFLKRITQIEKGQEEHSHSNSHGQSTISFYHHPSQFHSTRPSMMHKTSDLSHAKKETSVKQYQPNQEVGSNHSQRPSSAGGNIDQTSSISFRTNGLDGQKRVSKFESIRNIPLSTQNPSTVLEGKKRQNTLILPPSMLVNIDISEENTEDIEEEGRSLQSNPSERSRVDDVIYKTSYHLDSQKTSLMAAHLQGSLMNTSSHRPTSASGRLSHHSSMKKISPQNSSGLMISRSSTLLTSRDSKVPKSSLSLSRPSVNSRM